MQGLNKILGYLQASNARAPAEHPSSRMNESQARGGCNAEESNHGDVPKAMIRQRVRASSVGISRKAGQHHQQGKQRPAYNERREAKQQSGEEAEQAHQVYGSGGEYSRLRYAYL